MGRKYAVLIIEDHPLISDAYKSAFKQVSFENKNLLFKIAIANSCDSADLKINSALKSGQPIDIVVLDISLPPSSDGKILSGEDLGIKIRELLPNTKIIVSTMFNDHHRIRNIIKNVDPLGFLIKNDIVPKELVTAIKTVIYDPPYYSKSVIRSLRKQFSGSDIIDAVDRKMLYELSIGTKMKELPEILQFSMTGIEKRKHHLKALFDDINMDDKELLKNARERGFL